MFFNFWDSEHIIFSIFDLIINFGIIGNILFGTVWCVYFLFRIKVLRNKVYYLKKQTDERYFDALNNAKVDYIKSIFIAAISAFEVLTHLFVIGAITHQNIFNLPNDTCATFVPEYSYYSQAYRGICVLGCTSMIMFVSLIHILTSYLSHAYSEKRITNIMRRERVMFAWLFIQLVCVWCSILYWPLFMLTLPIMTVVALIGHLCLYWKYGRELYSVIRRRERDALFEDVHSHDKLSEMLRSYKDAAILSFVYICTSLGISIFALLAGIVRTLLFGDCQILKAFHLNIHILIGKETTKYDTIFHTVDTVFALFLIFPLLFIHISIMCKLITGMIKIRNEMYYLTKKIHSILNQPLLEKHK